MLAQIYYDDDEYDPVPSPLIPCPEITIEAQKSGFESIDDKVIHSNKIRKYIKKYTTDPNFKPRNMYGSNFLKP